MSYIEFVDFSAYYKLKKEYVVALDSISLSIEKGEFVTLLGPSGCGKTTLLKSILGQMELVRGSVFLDGKEVTQQLIRESNVAYVAQDHKLFPYQNVFENIAFPLRIAETEPEEVDRRVRMAAEKCGLASQLLNRKPRQLSAGQQQRVALARALVKKPELLLLDEPFSHLDAPLREELRGLVASYHEETGATVLFVTHDEQEAYALGSRMLWMGDGRVESSEMIGDHGERANRKTVSDLFPAPEQSGISFWRKLQKRLLYRWPVYLLTLVAVVFLICFLSDVLSQTADGGKLSVAFVGQDFESGELTEYLSENTSLFTAQSFGQVSVDSLYYDNGLLLAEALAVRCIDGTDAIVLEEDYLFPEIGRKYFSAIPKETVQAYFPDAVTYEEDGTVYGILIYESAEAGADALFRSYYDGEENCWLFFSAVSENAGGINGKGAGENTAALDLAAWLWSENQ